MCLPANQLIVETVIEELAQKRQMFTAYDVTSLAREAGATEYHRDLKGSVHAMWVSLQSDFGYDRTLITVDTQTGVQAWVYHPANTDHYDYDPDWRKQLKDASTPDNGHDPLVSDMTVYRHGHTPFSDPAAVQTIKDSEPTPAASPQHSNIVYQSLDSDGRLNLTRKMLNLLNVSTGDEVYVGVQPEEVQVASQQGVIDIVRSVYAVNSDGRVRLSRSVFDGFSHKEDFCIVFDENQSLLRICPEG